jgi:hypothetical protein
MLPATWLFAHPLRLTTLFSPLRHGYGPPLKGTSDNKDIGKAEGEGQDPQEVELSLKEQAKARLAVAVAMEVAA